MVDMKLDDPGRMYFKDQQKQHCDKLTCNIFQGFALF